MKYKKVYVFCPDSAVSGGPEALHQMVFYLNEIGVDASLVYFGKTPKEKMKIPPCYQCYVSSFLNEQCIVDDEQNAIIVPEVYESAVSKYKKCVRYIWWLSVDNNNAETSFFSKLFYFLTLPLRFVKNYGYYKNHFFDVVIRVLKKRKYSFFKESLNVQHLCASYYAFDYVSKRSHRNVYLCIEPISKFFLNAFAENEKLIWKRKRSNTIIYNPKKSESVVRCLADYDKSLNFKPLVGMSQSQLVEMYMSSKLYVDFGPFPGAERMPKEAVLLGCSVITGCLGASAFYKDVPISDGFKYENPLNEKDDVIKKMKWILDNFDSTTSFFNEYRIVVRNLEMKFKKSLKDIFLAD